MSDLRVLGSLLFFKFGVYAIQLAHELFITPTIDLILDDVLNFLHCVPLVLLHLLLEIIEVSVINTTNV